MPEPLTTLERRILDYLVDFVRHHTYQPSIRDIGAAFDIKSTKTVSEHLHALADKGWIERDPSRSRGVRLLTLQLDADVVSVPHVDVHLSDAALDEPLENLALDRRIARTAGAFLITMMGDAMRDAGVRDGDLLLVEPVPSEELDDGDMVVARVRGESMVRRLARLPGATWLEAAAPSVERVAAGPGEDVSILGRVTAVIRRLRTDARAGLAPKDPVGEGAAAG